MVVRVRSLAAPALGFAALLGLLSACAPTLGPPPPEPMGGPYGPPPAADDSFRAADFAWSQAPGKGGLAGKLVYMSGATRYTCAGASVILTPETPWSRLRMGIMYKSEQRSALPTDEVRARTPMAPPGDSGPYLKRTVCDGADHFAFNGLPDGAWYVITIAKPVAGAGPSMAVMRRVMTRAGRISNADL